MQNQTCLNSAERVGLRTKGNVPTLRFPEFQEEWACTHLKEHLSVNKERNKDNYFSKKDVLSVSGEVGIVNQIDLLGRSFAGKEVSDYHIVKKGNVVYTKSPLKEFPYGIIKVNRGTDGIVSTLYAVYDVLDNTDGRFIEYYFANKDRINRYLKPMVRIGAKHDMKIGNEEVLLNTIKMPSYYEQKRISDFLDIISKRIETQSRIIEELKLYRNTLVFRLLTPKDKWLRLSIGDVAHVIGGGTPDTNIEDYWNGNIQWYTPSEIGKKKYVTESERTLTQKGLDNSSAKLLPPNTILLSTRATIGECSIAKQECCTNQGFQSLIANKVTPEFLYYLIQTKKKDLLSKASGSTFAEISANEVRKIHICIPSTQEEQKAIVQPLSAYDEKIETECKILHLYELQKQFLLGQMFI